MPLLYHKPSPTTPPPNGSPPPPPQLQQQQQQQIQQTDGLLHDILSQQQLSMKSDVIDGILLPEIVERPLSNVTNNAPATTRAELIERIKAGENPTWSRYKNVNRLQLDKIPQNNIKNEPRNIKSENEKPHSALHSGVFSLENARNNNSNNDNRNVHHPPSPINPHFLPTFVRQQSSLNVRPPSPPSPLVPPQLPWTSGDSTPLGRNGRARTLSVSSLSNYVLKQPTSPLVHSSNTDEDNNLTNPIDISSPSHNHGRRPSLVPSTLSSWTLSPSSLQYPRQPSHVARKSLTTDNWYDSTIVAPPHKRSQSRRLSVGFGPGSDLPFGSFVGSYEESILSGRMSTTPSRPLDFIAQIGCLGLGKCKSSLKCPSHVTIPFPAYFYSVGDYDSPSPYVGQIDLETALSEKKCSRGLADGGYRISQKGQLQIVIKNPNKTAVKLFLIPYDLKDMEPGTKTFIRQKSYSADFVPDIKPPVPPTPRTFKKLQEREREALRYMIHLHICSPCKGKFYLHRNIRIVFANRVPDGKEKLRNEVHQPEPKYSPWKSGRTSNSASTGTSVAEGGGEFSRLAGRKRSTSLMYPLRDTNAATRPQAIPPLPPLPLQYAKPPQESIKPAQSLNDTDMTGIGAAYGSYGDSGYDKLSSSVYSNSSGRSDNEGLLSRRLKSLDTTNINGPTHDSVLDSNIVYSPNKDIEMTK